MKHIKLFESFNAFENAKLAYRWIGPAGLFIYFYGDIPSEKMYPYLFNNKKIDLPVNPVIDVSHWNRDEEDEEAPDAICMTVDPNYMGEPYNGDTIIRINFDFAKMKNELDASKFEDLTDNGEAEIRYNAPIVDWVKYVTKIDIDKEFFEKGAEDDFGDWSPFIDWFPSQYMHLVRTFRSDKELMVGKASNKFDKNKLR